jgi:heptosyltransferase-2
VDHYLDIVNVLGCQARSKSLELATTRQEEAAADHVWEQFGWGPHEEVVVLNTGGAYGAAKTWPAEHFSNLARWLVLHRDLRVLFLCGPAERDAVAWICQHAHHRHIKSLARQELSIGLSKACVRRARLMVTTDSGPRHFAAAFAVPTVSLFGPTDPRWSHNYLGAAINLQLDVDCGPCAKRICPLEHHRCMQDLTVNHVAVASACLLESEQRERERAA